MPYRAHDQIANRRDRGVRHTHRVGPHVGHQADRTVLADIDALVEVLRRPHGAPRGEAELLGGLLLQRAGGEGRGRALVAPALLDLGDDEGEIADRVHHRAGIGLIGELGLVPVHLRQRGLEGLTLPLAERLDGPVLLRLEGADIPLALDDQAERDRLHPAGREAGLDGAPEDRARLVADQPVEDPAGLLRVHLPLVDLARLLHRGEHGVPGDLLEQHPVHRHLGVDLVGDVPGDRLALAVRVGGEIDGGGGLGGLLQLGEGLRLSFNGDVLGLEPAFSTSTPSSRVGRSRRWPTVAFTS